MVSMSKTHNLLTNRYSTFSEPLADIVDNSVVPHCPVHKVFTRESMGEIKEFGTLALFITRKSCRR